MFYVEGYCGCLAAVRFGVKLNRGQVKLQQMGEQHMTANRFSVPQLINNNGSMSARVNGNVKENGVMTRTQSSRSAGAAQSLCNPTYNTVEDHTVRGCSEVLISLYHFRSDAPC